MSKYTTQIRWIVENATPDMKGQNISSRIAVATSKIFNFDYPIWTEDYRPILEKKILMHYFNKEIGFETVGLWKLYLEERLNLIMPYYNKLYETTVKDYDYMWDINDTEVYTGNKKFEEDASYNSSGNEKFHGTGSSADDGNASGTSKELSSDLPQVNYANVDYGTNLKEGEHSSTSHNKSTAENDSTNNRTQDSNNKVTNNTDDTFTRKRTGARMPLTDLLMKYRDSLINIDNMIIDELKDLFMMVY